MTLCSWVYSSKQIASIDDVCVINSLLPALAPVNTVPDPHALILRHASRTRSQACWAPHLCQPTPPFLSCAALTPSLQRTRDASLPPAQNTPHSRGRPHDLSLQARLLEYAGKPAGAPRGLRMTPRGLVPSVALVCAPDPSFSFSADPFPLLQFFYS